MSAPPESRLAVSLLQFGQHWVMVCEDCLFFLSMTISVGLTASTLLLLHHFYTVAEVVDAGGGVGWGCLHTLSLSAAVFTQVVTPM